MIWRIAYGTYAAALLGACLWLYPPLLHPSQVLPSLRGLPENAFGILPFVGEAADTAQGASGDVRTPATFLYRGSLKRLGYHAEPLRTLDLQLRWRHEPLNAGIHTASKASPAVDDSGIYVGGDGSWFYALDFDGGVRWRYHVAGADYGIHGTAALDAERVYFGAYNGLFYCLRKRDGALIWAVKLGDAVGSSPALFEDSLYVSAETGSSRNGYVARIRRSDGNILWRTPWFGDQIHSSPAIDTERRRIYAGDNHGEVQAWDLDSGRRAWAYGVKLEVKSTPCLAGGFVYVTSWGKRLHAIDAIAGTELWELPLDSKAMSSAAYSPADDRLFVSSYGERGLIYAVDRVSGRVPWWKTLDAHNLIASGTVTALADGRRALLYPCTNQALCAFDTRDGRQLAKIETGGLITGEPVIFKGSVYATLEDGGLVRLSPRESGGHQAAAGAERGGVQ